MRAFHSPEARAKAQETMRLKRAAGFKSFCRPRTEDEKARISATMKTTLASRPDIRAKRAPYGRVHSVDTRAKLSAAHLGMKHTPESRAKMSASKKGRSFHSLEWRAQVSSKLRGRPARFPNKRFYYKGCAFRSSWELRVAQAFDALGVRWEYESRRFDLGSQTYAPDFYLPDGDCYWEVKGYFGPKSRRTIALFRECYPDVILLIVNEHAMKALERAAMLRAA